MKAGTCRVLTDIKRDLYSLQKRPMLTYIHFKRDLCYVKVDLDSRQKTPILEEEWRR